MRTTTSEPQQNQTPTTVTHFSHPHPLTLTITNHQQQQTLNLPSSPSCAGCNLKPSETIYSCKTCNFFLHKKCFDMPKKITHPFHKEHTLTLLTKPSYKTGTFNCDACFEKGKGFSYSCDTCGIDIHILCAIMPLSVTRSCHPHKLELTFGSPYPTKDFNCDVCDNSGGDHWLYRCKPCGFDAHLNCAMQKNHTSNRSVHVVPPQPDQPVPGQPQPNGVPYGYPAGGALPMMTHQLEIERQNQLLYLQAIQQLMQQNNEMRQLMLSGGFGGGGGGAQQLMRMMSGLNNGGGNIFQMLGGGGIGGGGGFDIQSLLGGNGFDFLGGGGFDFLGGGGLDFLGGLGGFC